MGRLEGKVALVTGGGSGIGRATSLAFAREGAKVVVADMVVDGGEETVQMIKEAGGDTIFVKTDVTRADEVQSLIDKAVEAYGRLDCAFNNAGIMRADTLTNTSEETFDQVIGVNLKGVWLCMKYEVIQMLKQGGGGAIVNTGSVAALSGDGDVAYCAAKHGVVGMTKSAALECARKGIRINVVCPTSTDTPLLRGLFDKFPGMEKSVQQMQPMGRLARPEETAQAVVWLCSDEASFTTGYPLAVDGGVLAR